MGGIESGSTEQCYNLEYTVMNIVVITRNVTIITRSTAVLISMLYLRVTVLQPGAQHLFYDNSR